MAMKGYLDEYEKLVIRMNTPRFVSFRFPLIFLKEHISRLENKNYLFYFKISVFFFPIKNSKIF